MTQVGYRTLDLPVRGVGAFTPTLAVPAVQSSYGELHTQGAPSTMPVPAPNPRMIPISRDPATQGSNVSPDVILPPIYLASNWRPPVPYRHHNPIPMPSAAPGYVATPMQRVQPTTGRFQTVWPRVFQVWPSVMSRRTAASTD